VSPHHAKKTNKQNKNKPPSTAHQKHRQMRRANNKANPREKLTRTSQGWPQREEMLSPRSCGDEFTSQSTGAEAPLAKKK